MANEWNEIGKIGFLWRGDYSNTTQYEYYDLVSYQGKVWLGLKNNIGIAPTEGANWTMFCQQGLDAFVFIAYSEFADGTGFVFDPTTDTKYIGFGHNTVDVAPTNKDDYKWSEYVRQGAKGDKGNDGVSVTHKWNGTELEITSASGTSSSDLKGAKGDKGNDGTDGNDGATPTGITAKPKSGRVNTYTLNFSDGNGYDFTVLDGETGSGGGNMSTSVYDSDDDGVVDTAEELVVVDHTSKAIKSRASTETLVKFSTSADGKLLWDNKSIGGTVEVDDTTIKYNASNKLEVQVDSALSDTSTLPVQNKVVKEALTNFESRTWTTNQYTKLTMVGGSVRVDNCRIPTDSTSYTISIRNSALDVCERVTITKDTVLPVWLTGKNSSEYYVENTDSDTNRTITITYPITELGAQTFKNTDDIVSLNTHIGDMSALTTTANNLVGAINEVKSSGGGTVEVDDTTIKYNSDNKLEVQVDDNLSSTSSLPVKNSKLTEIIGTSNLQKSLGKTLTNAVNKLYSGMEGSRTPLTNGWTCEVPYRMNGTIIKFEDIPIPTSGYYWVVVKDRKGNEIKRVKITPDIVNPYYFYAIADSTDPCFKIKGEDGTTTVPSNYVTLWTPISYLGAYHLELEKKETRDIDTLNTHIGNLSSLTTTDKTSVINAINEVNGKSGSGGSKIRVNTSESSFYGKKVTVSLVGGTETVKATFSVTGKCEVNVQNIGTYTVSVTDSEGTFTQSVSIACFSIYDVTLAKFRAYIPVNVNGGYSVGSGAIVTASLSDGTSYTATTDSSGNATIQVGKKGTYTVSASKDNVTTDDTKSVDVQSEMTFPIQTISFAHIDLTWICDTSASWTISKSGFSKSGTATSSGSYGIYVPTTGIYTVSAEIDGETDTDTVNVSTYANYTLTVSADYVTLNITTNESTLQSAILNIYKGTDNTGTLIDTVTLSSGSSTVKLGKSKIGNTLPVDLYVYEATNDIGRKVTASNYITYAVEISLLFVIYNNGDEKTSITGGWVIKTADDRQSQKPSSDFWTKESTCFHYKYNESGESGECQGIWTNNLLDLTNYNSMIVEYEYVSGTNDPWKYYFGIDKTYNLDEQASGESVLSQIGTNMYKATRDISAFSGNYIIFCHSNHPAEIKVKKWYFI